MKHNAQTATDKTAISLSLLCTFHCLATPLLIALLPVLSGLSLENEAFHLWMVVIVLPISLYALTMGCKKHQRKQVLVVGGIGLFILVMTVILGHEILGDVWEKILTVLGSGFVSVAHIRNYRLCQSQCCH